jgi:hypothetical protein
MEALTASRRSEIIGNLVKIFEDIIFGNRRAEIGLPQSVLAHCISIKTTGRASILV